MIYKEFRIQNFKGLDDISISFEKNDLVLLLGLNESGKTTILKAIETFDHINDPSEVNKAQFYKSIRKKSETQSNTSAIITAKIQIDNSLKLDDFKQETKGFSDDLLALFDAFLIDVNKEKMLSISRIFSFKDGNPTSNFYDFISDHPFVKKAQSIRIAKRIVNKCSFIIYFEDFKDRIPERIHINKTSEAFNSDWYDIINGLFYTTNKNYSIDKFRKYYFKSNLREDDANSELRKVNQELNRIFTDKWKDLSGVQDIDETLLKYNHGKKYFEIKIIDKDGTNYSIDERSKGALWYLSFLMRTEFRRKKLRHDYGKSIFLIDEPASNLHSTAQTNMIKDFTKLVEEEDATVIYSTHSQYLISTANIKNTYIVRREEGVISCPRWSDYIKIDNPKTTYYQPLLNHLEIVPNDFSIPWSKAIITEGPSDRHVLDVMYNALFKKNRDYIIYPGTSAFSLSPLISLNIGWGATFKVILDSDDAGIESQKKYIDEFKLSEEIIQVLPVKKKKIESLFTTDERKKLYKLAFNKEKTTRITKHEFSNMFGLLHSDSSKVKDIKVLLSEDTVDTFKSIFKNLELK